MKAILSVTMAWMVIAPSSARAGLVIDFENWPSGSNFVTAANSAGFTFVPEDDFLWIQDNFSDASHNGSLTLFTAGHGGVTMTRERGGVFDLLTIDVAEGTLEAPSTSMLVTGFFRDGGSISHLIELDQTLPGFESVTFSGFSGLSTVTFDSFGGGERFSLDNIVVPEPGTLLLLSLGALVAMGRPLRRRISRVGRVIDPALLGTITSSKYVGLRVTIRSRLLARRHIHLPVYHTSTRAATPQSNRAQVPPRFRRIRTPLNVSGVVPGR